MVNQINTVIILIALVLTILSFGIRKVIFKDKTQLKAWMKHAIIPLTFFFLASYILSSFPSQNLFSSSIALLAMFISWGWWILSIIEGLHFLLKKGSEFLSQFTKGDKNR
jgi:uncharacterized protein YacL